VQLLFYSINWVLTAFILRSVYYLKLVILAEAGIHRVIQPCSKWIPAFAGMTMLGIYALSKCNFFINLPPDTPTPTMALGLQDHFLPPYFRTKFANLRGHHGRHQYQRLRLLAPVVSQVLWSCQHQGLK